MKLKCIILLALSFLGSFARTAIDGIDRNRLIDAIATVENTQGLGRFGERSPWQFTAAVWRTHSAMPFNVASRTDAASVREQRRVALAHVDYIMRHIERPTVYRIALAWNAGIRAVNTMAFSKASADYAQRVLNVYEEGL